MSRVILRSTAGTSIAGAVRDCLEACDWRSVVGRNAAVVIKPNLCAASATDARAANTDPEISAAVCRVLLERTNRISFVESDGIRYTAEQAYAASGYNELSRELGVSLVNLSHVPRVSVRCNPVGEVELPRMLLESDVFITLPVLKTHGLTYFTGALKNQWGCLPQFNRIRYHQYLHAMLASLHGIFRPKLALMDGIVAMEGKGPVAGKPRVMNILLASRDAVALDSAAMRLVGLDPQLAEHVSLAAQLGLGRMCVDEIDLDGEWQSHITRFEPATIDWANRIETYMSRYDWFVTYVLEKDLLYYPLRSIVYACRRLVSRHA